MNGNLITRYIWLVDLLARYEGLTREKISQHWMQSDISDGHPLPERTFFHYRRSIEEIFNIRIVCNRLGEYSVSDHDGESRRRLRDWMLDSMAISHAFQDTPEVAERVEVEDVPSAREYLPQVLDAIKASEYVVFTYAGFNRSRPESDILFRPYFLKRFKQRWYVAGYKEDDGSLRTYALDRVSGLHTVDRRFEHTDKLTLSDFFGNILGVTGSRAPVREVCLQATAMQAKYLRALPLHHSQREEVCDGYSLFRYSLKLNYELVHEIMSLGDGVKVIAPKELEVMVVTELRRALARYDIPGLLPM